MIIIAKKKLSITDTIFSRVVCQATFFSFGLVKVMENYSKYSHVWEISNKKEKKLKQSVPSAIKL